MLRNDKETLKNLVEEYGMLKVISILSEIAIDSADEYSDLGLKERAVSCVGTADMLNNLKEALGDSDL